jgi:hypothetical protein
MLQPGGRFVRGGVVIPDDPADLVPSIDGCTTGRALQASRNRHGRSKHWRFEPPYFVLDRTRIFGLSTDFSDLERMAFKALDRISEKHMEGLAPRRFSSVISRPFTKVLLVDLAVGAKSA